MNASTSNTQVLDDYWFGGHWRTALEAMSYHQADNNTTDLHVVKLGYKGEYSKSLLNSAAGS